MEFYLAPLEGITNYTYRKLHHKYFTGISKYYTPFIVANQNLKLKNREKNDIAPINNENIKVVPQILSNKADELIWAIKECEKLGYDEVNLNVGCPSKTVVTKGKGSGLLENIDDLKNLLDKVFNEINIKFSIKMRIGLYDDNQAIDFIKLLNNYPIYELIIHPRIQSDYYKKPIRIDLFEKLISISKHDIVYNGNIFDFNDYNEFIKRFPQIKKIMLGRGIIANPALARELLTNELLNKDEFLLFHNDLMNSYYLRMHDEKNVLFKMKEFWFYGQTSFIDPKKYVKKVLKSKTLDDYKLNVNTLINECEINHLSKKEIHFR